ncbi:ABC-2 transporter permease [Viridibacillus sp. YIM B01967]|uniref:ABC-2 transporter permease n=1 Tax=Viridibacillus soli TaxID=2798301 RepID=A0ABS1H371_9BACL|nr:ABC-2 transporter permease [Viridibacillus soli]MBK3493843.1 ABC-2 transporter permease [Viridibacillus soli]
MIALIQKDLMIVQKQLKLMLVMLGIFLIVSFMFNNGTFLSMFFIVFIVMQVITVLTYEEMSNWGRFANTIPVKLHQHILGKYILAVIFTGIGLILSLPLIFLGDNTILSSAKEYVLFLLAVMTLCFVLFSVLLPIFIKFGPNMGRIILVGIFLIPSAAFSIFGERFDWSMPSMTTLENIIYFVPIAGLLMMVISYIIAVQIYKKKEF